MTQLVRQVRSNEDMSGKGWPLQAQRVSYIGSACVVEGAGDFDTQDLALVRRQFPDRYVTLDGDVITVWPAPGRQWSPLPAGEGRRGRTPIRIRMFAWKDSSS